MSDLTWVIDDLPIRYFQLTHKSNDTVYDVSAAGVVVSAKFRARGDTDASEWTATCVKVKPELGIVSLQVPAAGLALDAGSYELEFTVTTSGVPETVLDRVTVRLVDEFPDS
jgi:hypothetical protein